MPHRLSPACGVTIATSVIYGRNPKPVMIIGAKAITSGVHYWVMRTLLPDHPGLARAFGWVTVTIQGSVVGLNLSQMF
ncbi:hypothetical protein NS277_05910 [Novosphingobium barchaimii]|nr:hypothetical protein NS277_05910 [Novosphingobium barchaimii]